MPLLARDIMQTDVRTVAPGQSLAELVDFLARYRISSAPVLKHGRLVGFVSRADVVRTLSLEHTILGLLAEYEEPLEFAPGEEPAPPPAGLNGALISQKVSDAMTRDPLTVAPETPLTQVARLLVDRRVHHVLVSQNDELRGVISTFDLVRCVADGLLRDA